MQVECFLEESAERSPAKTAIVCGNRRLTYAELDTLANRLAHNLLNRGLHRGERVAVYMDNSVEAVVSIFAIMKAGGVFVVINPSTKPDKLTYILNHSGSVGVMSGAASFRVLQGCLRYTPTVSTVWLSGESDRRHSSGESVLSLDQALSSTRLADDTRPAKSCIDMDAAALIYTSGSTGVAKAVMMTHLNIVSATTSIVAYLENTADDVILSVLPLSFTYGLGQVIIAFKLGATIVLERSFAYPHRVLETMVRERATGLPIVPTMAAILLQLDLAKYDLSNLRYMTSAAAVLPRIHITGLRRSLPGVRIYSMYGLTECSRVSYLPPDQIDIRPDSVGRGMPNQEVYIIDDNGNRAAPGVVGELVVRGSNVFNAYWNDQEETEKNLRPGSNPWEKVLYTGDLFRADEEGFLYFVARKDDIIKIKGEKVSPKEIEEVLYRLEGVAEAAILGIPDPVLGYALKAVVTLRPDADVTKEDILRHCSRNLDAPRIPKYIEIRDILPKSENGKINRKELVWTCTA